MISRFLFTKILGNNKKIIIIFIGKTLYKLKIFANRLVLLFGYCVIMYLLIGHPYHC